jgi:phenylacetate-CoA ligase
MNHGEPHSMANETLPSDSRAALQLARLRETVARLLRAVAPMRARLHEAGITDARDITSLDDLPRLPFTTKADLRKHYPFGLFAVPREQIAQIHASSGTTGKVTLVGFSRSDLDVWSECTARCLAAIGARAGMVFHNAAGYGLFTGGLGLHRGAERLGLVTIPASSGLTQRQVMLLIDLGAQVLHSTPSYALHIGETLAQMGLDPAALQLETGVFGGEPWTQRMRRELESALGLKAHQGYGLAEMIGPGVATECTEARHGLHIQDDHFLPEVVDPDTGMRLPTGHRGELVLTSLTKEALPMLRFRTRDLTALIEGTCLCGRTTVRMEPVTGRVDDMLIVRGVNLFPSEVERILLGLGGFSPWYQIIVDRPHAMDRLTVLCEPADSAADREALRARAAHALSEQTGLSVVIDVRPRGEVPRSEGKAVRVVDRRTT